MEYTEFKKNFGGGPAANAYYRRDKPTFQPIGGGQQQQPRTVNRQFPTNQERPLKLTTPPSPSPPQPSFRSNALFTRQNGKPSLNPNAPAFDHPICSKPPENKRNIFYPSAALFSNRPSQGQKTLEQLYQEQQNLRAFNELRAQQQQQNLPPTAMVPFRNRRDIFIFDKCPSLPPEELPKDAYTVKVRNVPVTMPKIGLFNFFKCLGFVTNIYSYPPVEGDEGSIDHCTVLVTFRHYREAAEVERLNNWRVFGNTIGVEILNNDDQSVVVKKQKFVRKFNYSLFRLQKEKKCLLKIFSYLNFRDRWSVRNVCANWRALVDTEFDKLPVPADLPVGVRFLIRRDSSADLTGAMMKYKVTEKILSITIGKVPENSCQELNRCVSNALRFFGPGVVHIEINEAEIDHVTLRLITKFCTGNKYDITLNHAINSTVPFDVFVSIVTYFEGRLTVLPKCDFPASLKIF